MRERMTRLWLLIVALVALLAVAAACGSDSTDEDATEVAPGTVGQRVETEGGSYVNVTPEELQSMLSGDDFLLLNVYAGDMGEIEDTDLFIPYDQIAGRFPKHHSSMTALIQIVNCYHRLGDFDRARTAHRRALVRLRELPDEAFNAPDALLDRAAWERWLENMPLEPVVSSATSS